MTFDVAFEKLARLKFRGRFKLSDAGCKYIAEKGIDTVRRHAEDFVRQKLAPAQKAQMPNSSDAVVGHSAPRSGGE